MSTPKQIDATTRTEHFAGIQLGESTERIKPEFRTGELRPTNLSLSWSWDRDRDIWTLRQCVVSGPIIKKDGTDSQNRGKRGFVGFYGGELHAGTPDWVTYLVHLHTPTAVGR